MRPTPLRIAGCRLCAAALLALALASVPVAASRADDQNAALVEMQRKLDRSLVAIQALTERVRELETKQTANAPATVVASPAAASAPASVRLETVEQKIEQLEAGNARRSTDDTGLPLHGFADVGAGTHNPINPNLKGFNVGNLDLYLAPRLGDHTRALIEMNTEVGSEGPVSVDLERVQIGYQFGDGATVWMGRFHTPYGYVNTALHHGSWINNSLRRPKFLQFEDNGGILPAHTVGVWVSGAYHLGSDRLLYDVFTGNRQQIIGGELDMRSAGNTRGSLGGGGRIAYQFNAGSADGLTLGLHALSARVSDDTAQVDTTRVLVYGGYAVYDADRWENIAELFLFDDNDQTGGSGHHHSNAGFVQFGYRSSWGVPYGRYERTALDQSDGYFARQTSGASYHRVAVGVRFDIDPKSALKLELAKTQLTDRLRDQYDEGLVQYAIRF